MTRKNVKSCSRMLVITQKSYAKVIQCISFYKDVTFQFERRLRFILRATAIPKPEVSKKCYTYCDQMPCYNNEKSGSNDYVCISRSPCLDWKAGV